MGYYVKVQGQELALDVFALASRPGWVLLKAPEPVLARVAAESSLQVFDRPQEDPEAWAALLALDGEGPDGLPPLAGGRRWARVLKPLGQRPARQDHRVELARRIVLFDDELDVEGRTVNISAGGVLVRFRPEVESDAVKLAAGRSMEVRLKIKGPELRLRGQILENSFPLLRLRFDADPEGQRRVAGELMAVEAQRRSGDERGPA